MTRQGATAPRPHKAPMGRPVTALLPNMRGKNMTQHSLGPWETDRAARGGIGVYTRQGAMVCKVTQWGGPLGQTTTGANAALIAAAPDMLAALEAIAAETTGYDTEDMIATIQGLCRDAIAKAKGGAA